MTAEISPETIEERLLEHWRSIEGGFPDQSQSDKIFRELLLCYKTPGRYYHTTEHILEVLDQVNALKHHAQSLTHVVLAAWYHDAVYNPKGKYNESESAVLAASHMTMLGFEPDEVGQVMDLIKGTIDHKDTGDPDFYVLSDADMAILASDPDRYDRYSSDVRQEYDFVPPEIWKNKEGRPRVLNIFLDRLKGDGHLFFTPEMQAREPQAKANMERELKTLSTM